MKTLDLKLDRRISFQTPRRSDYFEPKELARKLGAPQDNWPLVIAKELLDNATDALEMTSTVAPQVTVTLTPDTLTVEDNGKGIPESVVVGSVNYDVMSSGKRHYIGPTRGQMGNALKAIYAAPYVALGASLVEIEANGWRYVITASPTDLQDDASVTMDKAPCNRTIGTAITVYWTGIAKHSAEYQGSMPLEMALTELVRDYAGLNPHVSFTVGEQEYKADGEPFEKWLSAGDNAGAPAWYSAKELQELLGAFVKNDAAKGTRLSLRNFIAKFHGLKGEKHQQSTVTDSGLKAKYINQLVKDRVMDLVQVDALLDAMKRNAKATVSPLKLGVLGEDRCKIILARNDVQPEYAQHRLEKGTENGLPFVVEAAFGVKESEDDRKIIIGLNHTTAMKLSPIGIHGLLSEVKIDRDDPIVLLINIVCPKLTTLESGKNDVYLSGDMEAAFNRAVTAVTKTFTAAKKKNQNATREQLRGDIPLKGGQKAAAYAVMVESYNKASGDGQYEPNARQIFYVARDLAKGALNGPDADASFNGDWLPAFQRDNPDLTKDWRVHYDERGHLAEPHVRTRVGLGTRAVRSAIANWDSKSEKMGALLDMLYPTSGPTNRYKYALFIEKEGFDGIIDTADIARRYDLMLFSSKGQSSTAARELVEELSRRGLTILVVHDLDISGHFIYATLAGVGQDKKSRYTYKVKPRVIDLGLSLVDAQRMGLQHEDTVAKDRVNDPGDGLRERGVDPDTIAFLVGDDPDPDTREKDWPVRRIELNSMTAPAFITWLESKLDEIAAQDAEGTMKVIPDAETLADAWRHANKMAKIKAAIAQVEADATPVGSAPIDLEKKIREWLVVQPELSWDLALAEIAAGNPLELTPEQQELTATQQRKADSIPEGVSVEQELHGTRTELARALKKLEAIADQEERKYHGTSHEELRHAVSEEAFALERAARGVQDVGHYSALPEYVREVVARRLAEHPEYADALKRVRGQLGASSYEDYH